MVVDLKKWKQRNAAERVKAALTRPKKDNTGERLRQQFSTAADKAMKALNVKGRNPWLKYGYNDLVVVTAKLGSKTIAITGDEAIALKLADADAYLKDVLDATRVGQLDKELVAAAGATPARKRGKGRPKTATPVGTIHEFPSAAPVSASAARAPKEWNLKMER